MIRQDLVVIIDESQGHESTGEQAGGEKIQTEGKLQVEQFILQVLVLSAQTVIFSMFQCSRTALKSATAPYLV